MNLVSDCHTCDDVERKGRLSGVLTCTTYTDEGWFDLAGESMEGSAGEGELWGETCHDLTLPARWHWDMIQSDISLAVEADRLHHLGDG